MKTKRNGITLLEVVIVTSILLLLVGVIWFAFRPHMMRGAAEAAVRNDLKQIVAAINIYMIDNDNMYPLSLRSLPKGTPMKCTAFPADGRYRIASQGYNDYFYTLPWPLTKVMEKHNSSLTFDPDKHVIVKAWIIEKDLGGHVQVSLRNPKTGEYRTWPRRNIVILCAWLSGSVKWGPIRDEWGDEAANYMGAIAEEILSSRKRIT